MEQIAQYIAEHRQRFLDELFDLLRIPSVSQQHKHKEDMHQAAALIRKLLLDAGADTAEVLDTKGHPVVFAEKIIAVDLPTILVYGHYDVQPPEPWELWKSPPFVPEVRDGKIYARGADDDKGQLFMHIKAFELMMRTGTLPCNVKFMIEGEEEMGSPSLGRFCRDHREKLTCDVVLVSDTSLLAEDMPAITIGLRGLSYLELEVTGPDRDLHSGVYGGAVINPANTLAKMLAALTDKDHRITIPGFYNDVIELSPEERAAMAEAPFDKEAYAESIGVTALAGETGYTTMERTGIRPSLDVNGIWGGYTGEGAKTVLPAKAGAKVSMRLVPDQDPNRICSLFENYIRSLAPAGVKVKVQQHHGGRPYVAPVDSIEYQAASRAMAETFGREPIPIRSGGSIPIMALFEEILGVKSILMGFGLETDAIHSPNEHFPLTLLFKGIATIPLFYRHYAKLKAGMGVGGSER